MVNGEPRQVQPDQSITGLLECLGIAPDRVAIELNKSIIRKRDWERTTIPEGAQIEIVEFVGGG
jgi:thiamine biosynthesis protein ThiS